MANPIAVICSDVHYSISTLVLADKAVRLAIAAANDLEVPLIIAGDLHDTKANLRGECVSAMRATFKKAHIKPYVLIGNHCKINEKSEAHSLEFLEDLVTLVNEVQALPLLDRVAAIPYCHTPQLFKDKLALVQPDWTVIAHQGISGSNSGEYIQDKSAITKNDVAGRRVISGHYHTRQAIELPDGGKWDYVGNPYTLNFGEANDPPKGFRVLMDDGTLEFVPTNLRKHVVLRATVDELKVAGLGLYTHTEGDLLYIKIDGYKDELAKVKKQAIADVLGTSNFRLDLIPIKVESDRITEKPKSQTELLDALIDTSMASADSIARVKQAWRDLL